MRKFSKARHASDILVAALCSDETYAVVCRALEAGQGSTRRYSSVRGLASDLSTVSFAALAVEASSLLGTAKDAGELAVAAAGAIQRGFLRRIVVCAHPTPGGLRYVHHLLGLVPASLVVLGIDEESTIRSCFRDDTEAGLQDVIGRHASAFALLPIGLRAAVLDVLRTPRQASVKLIAARALITPRTVERRFATVGLPHPRVVLAEALASTRVGQGRDE